MKKDQEEIITFHKHILRHNLDEYFKLGINSRAAILAVNAMKILEEPLWKIPEANGKTNQRFISEGVKKVRDILDANDIHNRKDAKSIWTKVQITKALKRFPRKMPSPNLDYYKVQLEHVVEKRIIIDLLLNDRANHDDIIDQYNVGCSVLKEEHDNLPAGIFNPNNVWVRYKSAGIRVWDRADKKYVV